MGNFLKRLEIVGFKSFARKTVLEFPPGVTIIVGPNGCGKSNIFDAVRWVLGEQSPRSLRATRMGEVIFNGTTEIKPANLAQVSLVIDNRSSQLPVEIKEIVVTRRLFRDGESQYFINRVPCRLKDIQELFMDTGIGTAAYSMMEQGEVDFIINSRPQERREIFDEAAGIAKYKARKAEALRKLERTTEDLLRLSDVIAEVKHTLNSLKRQANRARYYNEVKEQMLELEKVLFCRRGDQVEQQLEELNQKMAQRQDALHQLNAKLAKTEAMWQEAQVKVEQLQTAVAKGHSTVYGLRSELEQLKNKCQLLKERVAEFSRRDDYFVSEQQSLKQKLHSLNQERDNYITALRNLEQELGELREKMEAKRVALLELGQQKKGIDEEVAKISAELEALRETEHKLQQTIYDGELARHKVEFKTGELQKEESVAVEQLNRLRDEWALKNKELEQLTVELEQLNLALKDRLSKHTQLQEAQEQLRSKKLALEAEIQQLKAEEQLLEQILKNYEGLAPGTREIMRAARDGEAPQVINVLSELIEVDKDYESAIELALSERLHYVLVTDVEGSKQLLEYLNQQEKKIRTVILPRNNPRLKSGIPKPAFEGGAESGIIGWATDFVQCLPEFQAVMETLLQGVLIVENQETALRLMPIVEYALVTRDGKLYIGEAGEFITGNGNSQSRLIGRQRRLKETRTALSERQEELKSLAQEGEQLKAELCTITSALTQLREAISSRELALSLKQKELETMKRQQTELEKKIAGIKTEITHLQAELANVKDVISQQQQLLNEVAVKIENLNQERQRRIESAASSEEQFLTAKSELQSLEATEKLILERRAVIEERLRRFDTEIAEVQAMTAKRQQELQQAERDKARLEREIASLNALIETRQGEEASCSKRLEEQVAELEKLRVNMKEWQASIHTLQRDRNELENEINDLKVKRAEFSSQLAFIDQQVKEKFGVRLAELRCCVTSTDTATEEIQNQLSELRQRLERLGPINPQALEDYTRQEERYKFLTQQQQDLIQAKDSLEKTIKTIDATCINLFNEAFNEIRQNFMEIFRRLFGGGRAELTLVDSEDILEAGVEIMAQPPGKKPNHIALLSGGERALTAIALMFALFLRKPSPFCILDEIDAPLDDYNVEQFKDLLKEFTRDVQFIIITHNKRTMLLGNTIYGVTMEDPGVSKVVSLSLEEVGEKVPLE